MEKIKLQKGEVICDKCKGNGLFCIVQSKHITLQYCYNRQCLKTKSECDGFNYQLCPKCNGEGKLDWVENIVGKRKHVHFMMIYEFQHKAAKHLAQSIDRSVLNLFLEAT